MKIAVIGPTHPFRGGIAHYTTLMVKYLRERHSVLFISYLKQYPQWLYPGNTEGDPSLSASALQVENERVLTPFNPLTWWRAYQMIRAYAPDLLILQWWTPFWTPMLFFFTRLVYHFTRIRVLFLCHHVIAPEGGLLDWFLARRIFWRANAFVVMSEEDFALLRRALPWARIKGISLPPYNVFGQTSLPMLEARKRLQLDTRAPVLLFFGFVRRYKGLSYLINALAEVRREIPAHLLIVGEFWEEERPYRVLVDRLGLRDAVTFHCQYVPNEELAVYFAAADVVVLPYLEATQSGVIQLAFGFSKPVIATSVGGIPETIRDGETGLIVPPADISALGRAITHFFREGCADHFTRNIQSTQKSKSWESLVDLIEELACPPLDASTETPPKDGHSPRII